MRPKYTDNSLSNVAMASDVEQAVCRIKPHLTPSPLTWCEPLAAWLKLENLQVTGSYKVRGALNALAKRVEAGDRRPVVASSAGNHGRAVAWAAKKLGLPATVVMPEYAPQTKVKGTQALGARVVLHGGSYEEAEEQALRLVQAEGGLFLSPFNDVDVIAGQGTIGLELSRLAPDVVLVPIGGGGLAAGVGLVLKPRGVRVIGVQVEGVDSMARYLAGSVLSDGPADTIADGLRVRAPGVLTRQLCSDVLDDIVIVSETEVRMAVARLALTARVVAEGAGATAVAALSKVKGACRVAIVSGGNIDPTLFGALLNAQGDAQFHAFTPDTTVTPQIYEGISC